MPGRAVVQFDGIPKIPGLLVTIKIRKVELRKSEEPWVKRRGYRHFDSPHGGTSEAFQKFDPRDVARHAFVPLIEIERPERRYDKRLRAVNPKPRQIMYASHKDAKIYAWYARLLGDTYEERISKLGISDQAIAYRRLAGKQSNIHFAKQVFDQIKALGDCDVIAADVKGFFDSLDHGILKQRWGDLIGESRLPADHFAVFNAITRYRSVKLAKLKSELQLSKTELSHKSKSGRLAKPMAKIEVMREVFKRPNVVSRNDKGIGIPQGSPISAVLSNLYMLELDFAITKYVAQAGGFYRRYSDDILLIVPSGRSDEALEVLREQLAIHRLNMNEEKLEQCEFRKAIDAQSTTQPLTYLGFTFDGENVRIRARSLSRFQQRMIRAVKRAACSAKARQETSINKRTLYARYAELGCRNFMSYARRAIEVFYPKSNGKSPIDQQLRHHRSMLHERIEKAEFRLRAIAARSNCDQTGLIEGELESDQNTPNSEAHRFLPGAALGFDR
jgi:RNA-directed DNA polymerase